MEHETRLGRRRSKVSMIALLAVGSAFLCGSAQAETPRLAAWHSMKPLDLAQSVCLQRAVDGLGAAGLTNTRTQDGWNASATSADLHAAISCVAVTGGVLVDVQVAGDASSLAETEQARDYLKQHMLGGEGSPGGPGQGPASPWDCFEKHANHLLPGHNISDQGLRADVERCLEACRSEPRCTGLDYNLETGKCFLQSKDRSEVALKPSQTYDHYDHICEPQTAFSAQVADCFTRFSDSSIPGHNVETLTTSLDQCKKECRERPWCKSLDYDSAGRKCYLQNVDRVDVGGLARDDKYDHYRRDCD